MGEVYCKEKPTVKDTKDYINNLAKQYQLEKLFDRNRVFIKKQSDFIVVKRIIHKYQQESTAEFDTIFKLYKLQKYLVDEKYFKGTQYKVHTLNMLRSIIRSSTIDSTIPSKNKFRNLINDFIGEIKEFSKPFSGNLVEGKRRKVDDLLNCGSLNKEEIEFINSEIKPTYFRKKKEKLNKVIIIQGENEMNTRNNDAINRFKFIIQNYSKGAEFLTKMLPNLKQKSIYTYIGFVKQLEKNNGTKCPSHCPISLYNAWMDYKTNPNSASEVVTLEQNNPESITSRNNKLRMFSEEDFKIIFQNYNLPTSQIHVLLPNSSKRTLTNYCSCLKNLDKGKEKSPSLPNILYNMWKEKNQNKPITNGINPVEKQNSINIPCQIIKPIIDDSNTVKIGKYVLIQNGIEIIKSDSKDYIQGYKDALINSIQIYQIND